MRLKAKMFSGVIHNKLLRLILSSTILRVASALIGLLFTLYITNFYDINTAGVILLYFGIFTFLSFNFRFGMDTFIIRELNSENRKTNDFTIFVNGISIYTIFFIFGFFISAFFVSSTLYYVFYITIFFNGIHYFVSFILQANSKPALSITFQNLLFITATLIISLLFSVDEALEFSYCFLAASFITSVISLFLFLKNQSKKFYGLRIFISLKNCFPFFLILFFSQASQWSGQFILGYYDQSELVAVFASVQRISLLISFFLISINFVIAPRFARLFNQGNIESLKKTYLQGMVFTSILTLPGVLLLIAFPSFVLGFFGEGYAQGSYALRVMSIAQLINVFTGSVAILLNMTRNEKIVRNVNFFGALITILFSFLLIPLAPLEGAAFAVASGIIVVNCINFYFVHTRVFKEQNTSA